MKHPLTTVTCVVIACLITGCAAADVSHDTDKPAAGIKRVTRDVSGWKVHIDQRLLDSNGAKTERSMVLLKKMLDEIVRVVPRSAVADLRKVPLYFSPPYGEDRGRAEFHHEPDWLRDNGRDPVMAGGVEFTCVDDFEAEMERMPNFALHELAHAYHFHVLKDGFENAEVKTAFDRATASGKYDRVERHRGYGKPNTFERSYAMTNQMEYFAECTEGFFSRNDFYPFTHDELKKHDPAMFALLTKLWRVNGTP